MRLARRAPHFYELTATNWFQHAPIIASFLFVVFLSPRHFHSKLLKSSSPVSASASDSFRRVWCELTYPRQLVQQKWRMPSGKKIFETRDVVNTRSEEHTSELQSL